MRGMAVNARLICASCGTEYDLGETVWRCVCGGLLDLTVLAKFDPHAVRGRAPTLWRYREMIPVPVGTEVSFSEGYTPLIPYTISGRQVLIKQDHLFQTGSYKDRGAAVLISQARALGVRRVVEDSSGNAGCAIAAYCALAGIDCAIYVPADTSPGKLAQIKRMGAELHLIPGSREDTARAVMAAAESEYYASHSWNPFFFHGTKTFAYEVCEQLGWRAPDALVLPAGNGTLLLGVEIGFRELLQSGVIESIPAIYAVQSAACAPLAEAERSGSDRPVQIEKRDTLAEGIAIAEPVRGAQIMRAVRQSGGQFITVSEDEIRSALVDTCRRGFYIEPTSAATIAGIAKLPETLRDSAQVVSLFSGHGLKATEKMLKL